MYRNVLVWLERQPWEHIRRPHMYCWRKCNLCADCSKARVYWWRYVADAGSQSTWCIRFLHDSRRSTPSVMAEQCKSHILPARSLACSKHQYIRWCQTWTTAGRDTGGGALALSLKNVKPRFASITTLWIGSHKKNQNRCPRHVSLAPNVPKSVCGRNSAPDLQRCSTLIG